MLWVDVVPRWCRLFRIPASPGWIRALAWFGASLLVAGMLMLLEGGWAPVADYLNDLFFISPHLPGLF